MNALQVQREASQRHVTIYPQYFAMLYHRQTFAGTLRVKDCKESVTAVAKLYEVHCGRSKHPVHGRCNIATLGRIISAGGVKGFVWML